MNDFIIVKDNSDDGIARSNRIFMTLGYAYVYLGDISMSKIIKLYDLKGVLNIIWHKAPSEFEKYIFRRAWLEVGDGTELVSHRNENEKLYE